VCVCVHMCMVVIDKWGLNLNYVPANNARIGLNLAMNSQKLSLY